MMKKTVLLLIGIIAVTAIALSAESIIYNFSASSDNQVVTLNWKTNDESNITGFDIERSVTMNGGYSKVDNVKGKGKPGSYEFIDRTVYKEGTGKSSASLQKDDEYYYRIKIIKSNSTYDYTDPINVIHKTSTIRKTWGMIKEMMR
jgi:predicted small secreted protein